MKISNISKLALVIIMLSACGKKEKIAGDNFNSETIPVKVVPISSIKKNGTIDATGLITTENEVKYAFKIGGVVDKILVSEGESFKKGKLLATLKLTEIEAGVTQAKLGLEKAQRDYQRVANLQKENVATLEQLQNSKTAVDIAQQQLESLIFNKQFSYIKATASGFVTKKITSDGEVVGSGMPVLATNETSDKSSWVLRVGLNDAQWSTINVGNTATIILDAFPNKILNAVVSKKLLAADQNSGSLQAELKVLSNENQLALGLFGKAKINSKINSSNSVIPYDALIEANGNKAFVFVPVNGNKVKKVPITINSFNNKEVTVASGLENISEIVVSNSAFLNEASTIKIIK